MKKAYFQYYETFEIVVQKFKTAEQREHFRSVIINYGFYGIEPTDLNELEDMAWVVIKELIDQQLNRRKTQLESKKAKQEEPKEAENCTTVTETQTQQEETQQNVQPKEQTTQTQKETTTPQRFEKPTLEEIKSYIKEKNYSVNAESFFSYYESVGWRVGKNPMKNWKSAIQSWNARDGNRQNGTMWQQGSADTGAEAYENYF